jgi:hypothetical protein
MANGGGWTNCQQQDMSEFDNGDTFSTGDGFNIGELSSLDGMYDNISLCIYCTERRHFIKCTPTFAFRLLGACKSLFYICNI